MNKLNEIYTKDQEVIYEGKVFRFVKEATPEHWTIVKPNTTQTIIASKKKVYSKEAWEQHLKDTPSIGIQNWIAP